MIRDACGPDFFIVTPGIRPAWASVDDQKRIVSPAKAIQDGADYLVVGRPLPKPKVVVMRLGVLLKKWNLPIEKDSAVAGVFISCSAFSCFCGRGATGQLYLLD